MKYILRKNFPKRVFYFNTFLSSSYAMQRSPSLLQHSSFFLAAVRSDDGDGDDRDNMGSMWCDGEGCSSLFLIL